MLKSSTPSVPDYPRHGHDSGRSGSDLLESVDKSLKQLRSAPPSLLQVEAGMPRRVLKLLMENFEVGEDIVVRSADRVGFSDWMALYRLPIPSLKDAPFAPRTLRDEAHHDTSVFDDIREQDRLLHHPFDSFSAVETFVCQASRTRAWSRSR
jgi:polyphosphate kinase